MNCWTVRAEPTASPGLAATFGAWHLAMAAFPWLAGCTPAWSAGLTAVALATLPATLAGVPGRYCGIRALAGQPGAWQARLPDGAWRPAVLLPGSRVTAAMLVLRLAVAGRRVSWWIPRHALPAGDFRRLKVAARAADPGAAADGW